MCCQKNVAVLRLIYLAIEIPLALWVQKHEISRIMLNLHCFIANRFHHQKGHHQCSKLSIHKTRKYSKFSIYKNKEVFKTIVLSKECDCGEVCVEDVGHHEINFIFRS